MSGRDEHWDQVYGQKASETLSWFQERPKLSLELIQAMHLPADAPILDVGAGTSSLADALLARGYRDVTLVDLSNHALQQVARRVAPHPIETVVSDITAWRPSRRYALWHDRGLFHFLTDDAQRAAYRRTLIEALAPGGHVVIAGFTLDGPASCSGLPVQRYGVEELAEQFAGLLRLVAARREKHLTPTGLEQAFVYAHFVRRKSGPCVI
jgi:SAM-dependent methyltransferase